MVFMLSCFIVLALIFRVIVCVPLCFLPLFVLPVVRVVPPWVSSSCAPVIAATRASHLAVVFILSFVLSCMVGPAFSLLTPFIAFLCRLCRSMGRFPSCPFFSSFAFPACASCVGFWFWFGRKRGTYRFWSIGFIAPASLSLPIWFWWSDFVKYFPW